MQQNEKFFHKFLIVWSGQFVSAVGSGLTAFALGVYIFQQTHSSVSFSLNILFAFLPSFFLLPFGGVLADRFNRRKMMILGDSGAVLGLVLILYFMKTSDIQLWQIYLGVALSSVFTGIQSPAYKASVTDLVPEEAFSKASGLIQLANSAQFLISPILAGVLMNYYSVQLVLLLDISTFLIAVGTVFLIHNDDTTQSAPENQTFFRDLKDSLLYLHAKKGLFSLIVLTAIICYYIGLLQSMFGPLILTLSNSKTLGIGLSVAASGMLISSLTIGIFGVGRKKVFILTFFLSLAGLFYALIGLFTNIILIIAFSFLFFLTLPYVNTSLEVLIRTNVDNELQGRVWSLAYAISQIGYILAFGTSGFLVECVFDPLLLPSGALSQSIGTVFGTGQGRGIGVLFFVSGITVILLSALIAKTKSIQKLEIISGKKQRS